MRPIFEIFQQIGSSSADVIWFPVLIWTFIASFIFFALRIKKSMNPLHQYHIRVATLLALPIGLISAVLLQVLTLSTSTTGSYNPAFLVINNPLPSVSSAINSANISLPINWMDVNFLIGMLSVLLTVVALVMIIRLTFSYAQLKNLYKNLSSEPLTNLQFKSELKKGSVSVVFHDHPLVPFTFGWKYPIIVLPKQIEKDTEKLNMAIQHELVHIRRGDYLLQLAISLIQSLFWFHPLVHIGTTEIETYREISCDQEVLNTSDVHPKKYAQMLFELMPLSKGYGSFTVSMAVKQSTLKQRIETMKHHKMHKTSYKRSLFLLLSITLLIIAPIACSDLKGTDTLSEQEILNEKISLTEFKVEINGIEVLDASKQGTSVSTQGIGALMIHPKDYGVFLFSLIPFEGASLAGTVDGNRIQFKTNELDVRINSTSKILQNNPTSDLWVYHSPNSNPNMAFASIPDANLPPPPPPTSSINPNDKDVFVVVENMPELEGGQVGIQSKVTYPPVAIRAGIEGRVTIQFVVDENGDVVDPKVIRGIGGGCDEEALRVISQAKFTPGKQKGENVAVQMALPILFRLTNSEFKQSSDNAASPPPPPINIETLESANGTLKLKLSKSTGPLIGATVAIKNEGKGGATNNEGIATITGLENKTYTFVISYAGWGVTEKEITIDG